MNSRNSNSTFELEGRIDARTHDVSTLKSVFDDWDSLSDRQKMNATREVEPIAEETVYNVTTDLLHKYFVKNLDPDDSSSGANLNVSFIGLGVDSNAGVATSDLDLNDRQYEEQVTDVANNGKELLASTFLDSTEGNGNDFSEVGLFTGDPNNATTDDTIFMMNHATFSSVTKDNSKTVTFDVTLSFSDT